MDSNQSASMNLLQRICLNKPIYSSAWVSMIGNPNWWATSADSHKDIDYGYLVWHFPKRFSFNRQNKVSTMKICVIPILIMIFHQNSLYLIHIHMTYLYLGHGCITWILQVSVIFKGPHWQVNRVRKKFHLSSKTTTILFVITASTLNALRYTGPRFQIHKIKTRKMMVGQI